MGTMDSLSYVRFAGTLVLVLGMILGMVWVLRRFLPGANVRKFGAKRRLGIVEVLPLDTRRRLVLVRRDGREHLLLIGGVTDMLVEPDIPVVSEETPKPQFVPQRDEEEQIP